MSLPSAFKHHCKIHNIDIEMVNVAIDIEITPEMNPVRIRKVVETRLQNMSRRDRAVIPAIVWEHLDGLDSSGVGFSKYNPTQPPEGGENKEGWFSVQRFGEDTAHLIPRKSVPRVFLQSLRSKERFRHWEKVHKPKIDVQADRLVLTGDIFNGMSEPFLKTVIGAM